VLGDLLEDGLHAVSSPRINGVTPAIVVDNFDAEGQGRVQVRFPWMPDIEPWARMCAPVAGSGAGIFALPQVGDEVLVAFANGDVTQPYLLGGLWSMTSRPPAPLPTDALNKRVIMTPTGHAITLDDVPPSITIEHLAGHKFEMTANAIRISTTGGAASIELTAAGEIKIKGSVSVAVGAPDVKIAGDVSTKVTGGASAELSASGPCKIAGAVVQIN
jgi:uncharacterized protein involved in type VI secretion and phage assembly